MANVSQEVNIEMLEKLSNGTYKKKNPATKAEIVTFNNGVDLERKLANHNSYSTSKDENGIFKVVEYKDNGGRMVMKSTLSSPDAEGNYEIDTWQVYNDTGLVVTETIVWNLTYDEDGDILSKVVV